MRRYTVKTNSFGDMPIAGYITEIMDKVAGFDGWNILNFAEELNKSASLLDEKGSGELFIMIYSDDLSACYNSFEFCFTLDENEFGSIIKQYENEHGFTAFKNTRILRLFGNDEDFGLEELEIMF